MLGRKLVARRICCFPGGALIDEEPWRHAQAVTRTTALMIDERVPAIFEGAFEFDGIRIRVDVLERLGHGTWGLREVKSSTGPKDYHFDDIALQAYVLKGAGVAVSSIELIHVNTAYVRGPGGVCWPDFFARMDVTDAVAARLADLPARLPAMRDCLGSVEVPALNRGASAARRTIASSGTVHCRQARRLDRLSPPPLTGQRAPAQGARY